MVGAALAPSVLAGSIPRSKADEFAQNISKLVTSDPFVEELRAEIGMVQPGESEEEFVDRASDLMRELIRKKLADE